MANVCEVGDLDKKKAPTTQTIETIETESTVTTGDKTQ